MSGCLARETTLQNWTVILGGDPADLCIIWQCHPNGRGLRAGGDTADLCIIWQCHPNGRGKGAPSGRRHCRPVYSLAVPPKWKGEGAPSGRWHCWAVYSLAVPPKRKGGRVLRVGGDTANLCILWQCHPNWRGKGAPSGRRHCWPVYYLAMPLKWKGGGNSEREATLLTCVFSSSATQPGGGRGTQAGGNTVELYVWGGSEREATI